MIEFFMEQVRKGNTIALDFFELARMKAEILEKRPLPDRPQTKSKLNATLFRSTLKDRKYSLKCRKIRVSTLNSEFCYKSIEFLAQFA